MFRRALGFWAVRRAYRLLIEDTERPLRARLAGEAKRILIVAALAFVLLIAALVAAIVVLVQYFD